MKNTALFAASLLFSLFLVELSLRFFDVYAFEQAHALHPNEPQFHDPDDELGWVLRPGRYVWEKPGPGLGDRIFTIGLDRLRTAGPGGGGGERTGAGIGGAWLFGYGLSDAQTFAWKLRRRLNNTRVLNLGVTAYGTTQSWLALKRRLDVEKTEIDVVLYGLIMAHESRNVADYSWRKSMYFVNANRVGGPMSIPFVALDGNDGVVFKTPEGFSLSPLAQKFLVWRLVEDLAQRLSWGRQGSAEEATLRLVRLMSDELGKRGIRFIVLYFGTGGRKFERYRDYFAAHDIRYLDLRMPDGVYGEWRLPFDKYGHLGEAAQDYWAGKITASGILKTR